MKRLVDEWLNYARKDLKTAELINEDPELTNIVTFHCHQCIEKSFKAFIVLKTGEIPKIHNLIRLYGTVRNYLKIKMDMEIFEMINETYIDARYPSDLGLLPNGMPTAEEAIDILNETKNIFHTIEKEIVKIFDN